MICTCVWLSLDGFGFLSRPQRFMETLRRRARPVVNRPFLSFHERKGFHIKATLYSRNGSDCIEDGILDSLEIPRLRLVPFTSVHNGIRGKWGYWNITSRRRSRTPCHFRHVQCELSLTRRRRNRPWCFGSALHLPDRTHSQDKSHVYSVLLCRHHLNSEALNVGLLAPRRAVATTAKPQQLLNLHALLCFYACKLFTR